MYAIVQTGGKQYRVEAGRSVVVERLEAEEGAAVELGEVLLIADNGSVTIGTPLIEGARVLAQVESNGRGKKIVVFKYKSKVRTRKKTGHRQSFSKLAVREILLPGQESKLTEEVEAPVVEVEEAPVQEPTRRPRLRRAPKAEEQAKPQAAPAVKPEAKKPRAKAQPKKPASRAGEKPAAKKPSRRPSLRRKKE